MPLKLDTRYIENYLKASEIDQMQHLVSAAHESLHSKTGAGSEFLGWVELPANYDKEEFARIKKAAEKIKLESEVLVVIGIGGSYLGARAAIEFIKSQNYNMLPKDTPDIYFAGKSLSPAELNEIITLIGSRDFSINIISKSGTTTEPALAFRILKKLLVEKYGEDGARKRIYCTTDKAKGALKTLADREEYECFVIPDDVGGRYSVLTAVGMLPIMAAGCDGESILKGAAEAQKEFMSADINMNDCYKYAAIRNILYNKGKSIEVLVSYEPSFAMMCEWYKQLFAESEGKDNKGIYPSSMIFSTDLHSLGQYVQDGSRNLFETVVSFKNPKTDIFIEKEEEDFDELNFLSGQNMSEINRKAFLGTLLAHVDGGAPNIILTADKMNEYEFGYMVYFFEKACAISGYLLGINPFNQPGVEDYKRNMFALLGKAGFETEREALLKKLNN